MQLNLGGNKNTNNAGSSLEMAKDLLAQQGTTLESVDGAIQSDLDIYTYTKNLISSNACSTIGIKYKMGEVFMTTIYNDIVKLIKFPNFTSDLFWEFCKEMFEIDREEKYNCSRSLFIGGVQTRAYALMPPFCSTPDVTISTTKTPPTTLSKKTIPDEVWDEIVHNNFIIVGASGSGKTYLTNYLLSNYIRKNERIALIEEFGELIPPNELTSSIIVPPPKPGEESLLKFVTQQSNLMRLDAFYVGEVKGAEAWPMVVNMASGTRGGCTLHGETAVQALNRLRALCQESCSNNEAIDEFIAKSIRYIVVMKKRNIEKICRLTGTHNKNSFAMEEVYS